MVSVEEDGVVRVPAEGAVLAGVRAVVDVVGALGRGRVGVAGTKGISVTYCACAIRCQVWRIRAINSTGE